MSLHIQCVTVDAHDIRALAEFWAEALAWRITDQNDDEVALEPPEGTTSSLPFPDLLFIRVPDDKTVKNRWHLDLRPDDQEAEVRRLEGLGARRADIGQGSEVSWVVMTDPEGNEFCVLRPRGQNPTG
jgi:predicted enzyme related to lactoylglutathione lyase